ncbi:hypothetical protein J6590_078811 [Homalodisca vitripennis]|nr:hypothetical protein J6590_078811 [Homalodisca vitripennis]
MMGLTVTGGETGVDCKWLGSETDLSVLRERGRRKTGDSDDDSGVFCWEWDEPYCRRRRDTWPHNINLDKGLLGFIFSDNCSSGEYQTKQKLRISPSDVPLLRRVHRESLNMEKEYPWVRFQLPRTNHPEGISVIFFVVAIVIYDLICQVDSFINQANTAQPLSNVESVFIFRLTPLKRGCTAIAHWCMPHALQPTTTTTITPVGHHTKVPGRLWRKRVRHMPSAVSASLSQDPFRDVFRELKLLTLPCVYVLEVVMYCWNMEVYRAGTSTRVQQHRTTAFAHLPSRVGVKVINKLPECIKQNKIQARSKCHPVANARHSVEFTQSRWGT